MKPFINNCTRYFFYSLIWLALICMALPSARAGLTMTIDFYRNNQGQFFNFYTPLATNNILPAAPFGTYIIQSPGWPTNGSQRAFDLTAAGLSDHNDLDSEHGYNDFNSALQQITNGNWTIVYTNTTKTNLFSFTVRSPNINSNVLPATIVTYPTDGGYVPTNVTTFMWLGPTNWGVLGDQEVFGIDAASLPASQTQWSVPVPVGTGYTFHLNFRTNYATSVFVVSTPLNTNNAQPISGWSSTNVFETGNDITFSVFTPGPPTIGHTNLAFWAFDDNTLFTTDLSGNNNDIVSYTWFEGSNPPFVVTNDAAYGPYAAGFGGGCWLNAATNLCTPLSESFSISLWVKTTNAPADDQAGGNSGAGLVSLNSDQTIPMAQTGSKLGFYTGGNSGDTLHSVSRINTGNYTHLVVTRDASSGQKIIYINGVQDTADYAVPGTLTTSSDPQFFIGESTTFAADFIGELDQIQVYSGVLSSNEVAFLYQNPGTNVADISSQDVSIPVVAVYDFENTNYAGADNSGHGNDAAGSFYDDTPDISTNDAASGNYAEEFFGDSSYYFYSGQTSFANLSNALSGGFTVTAWVKTTNTAGFDYNNAYFGASILADYSSATNHLIFSITGSKAAFDMSDPSGNDTQLHSTVSVNDGLYHLLAFTRNPTNGLISLYVDGFLNATNTGTTDPIILTSFINLAGGTAYDYAGILDDVRIYGGELTAADVGKLFGNPLFTLGAAVNAPQLPWSTSGDTGWTVETTNTEDNIEAAQSGPVIDQQSSTITTTVNGPGTLTFFWSSLASGDFDYEFDIDGDYADDISGDWPWSSDTFYLSSGPHTLTWTTFADGDEDPTETGFLDEVSFVPNSPVNLSAPQTSGANFQFQFPVQFGFTYYVEYTTDLDSGNWQTYTTIYGDGTSEQTISVPFSVFGSSQRGFVRVQTQ